MSYYIDVNCDLGESFGVYTMGMDAEVLQYATSANVACGWHAGDPMVMLKTVEICKQEGVAVGAHPGYPDLLGFGRRHMAIQPEEAKAYMVYQVGALQGFCNLYGLTLQHIKLHGAFYNTVCVTPVLADAILDGIEVMNPSLAIMALSGSYITKAAQKRGISVIHEVFADRGYTEEGTLVSRSEPGAFIHDPNEAVDRVLRMIKEGTVITNTGKSIPIQADSVCVHGDNPQAIEFVKGLREGLIREGITLSSFQTR